MDRSINLLFMYFHFIWKVERQIEIFHVLLHSTDDCGQPWARLKSEREISLRSPTWVAEAKVFAHCLLPPRMRTHRKPEQRQRGEHSARCYTTGCDYPSSDFTTASHDLLSTCSSKLGLREGASSQVDMERTLKSENSTLLIILDQVVLPLIRNKHHTSYLLIENAQIGSHQCSGNSQ